ncbi:MAG: PilZ domain-containing protein [Gammaproteobacteria bacterium]|nr:PilZ domain-containing protein [Gammaproteobacteria bacterium]
MNNPDTHPLAGGLVYEDHLALQWSAVEARPDESEAIALAESNLDILRTLLMLGDSRGELAEDSANVAHELARMDFKLNLVLDLVGEVLSYYHDQPARVLVRLGMQGVEWEAAEAPAPGGLVGIELYLSARYPRALRLLGRVRSVTPLAQGMRTVVMFEDTSESVQDLLEKIIFRHHRRRIAHARRSATPS